MKSCPKCQKENADTILTCCFCGGVLEKIELDEKVLENEISSYLQYDSIGGWLIGIGIGRVLSPFMQIKSLIEYCNIFFSKLNINLTSSISKINKVRALQTYVSLEIISMVIMLLFDFILLYLFFKRKKSFPRAIISYGVANLVFSIALYSIYKYLHIIGSELNSQLINNISRSILGCAFNIAYFKWSERVKGTFIH